jgi:hypothetical protein
LIEGGRLEDHNDFDEVYFRYKQLIGEGFESREDMVAAMDASTPEAQLRRERKRLRRLAANAGE